MRAELTEYLDSLGDPCKSVLEQLHYDFAVDQVFKVARQEKRQFFSALHAVSVAHRGQADAVRYLNPLRALDN